MEVIEFLPRTGALELLKQEICCQQLGPSSALSAHVEREVRSSVTLQIGATSEKTPSAHPFPTLAGDEARLLLKQKGMKCERRKEPPIFKQ